MNFYKIAENRKPVIGVLVEGEIPEGYTAYEVGKEPQELLDAIEAEKAKQLAEQAKLAIYDLLDQTAKQYDYRSFAEVSQFLNSGVWKKEAEALLAWQDAVWLKAYELLKEPVTTVDAFVSQLPKYVSKAD